MNKQRIKHNFNSASRSYDEVATIQNECAQILVTTLLNKLNSFHPLTILDLGSGTGYIPEFLLPTFPNSLYTLNDIAPGMLNIMNNKFGNNPKLTFHLGDFESAEFPYHDLIISNFALQWVNQLENIIKKLYLNSEVLAFTCLLDGTFKEWEDIVKTYVLPSPVKKYPSKKEFETFLLSLQPIYSFFEIREFQMEFSEVRSFLNYLKKLGANAGINNMSFQHLKNIVKTPNHPFTITYRVLFTIVRRS